MKYTIIDIIEWDYGCEGVPDDEEPMCNVIVKDENGEQRTLRLSDTFLNTNKLNVGDTFLYD